MNELNLFPVNEMNTQIDKLSIPAIINGSVGYYYVDLDKIFYLESNSNRTVIHKERDEQIKETEIEATKTLLYFENELRGKPFLRIHNSFIINVQKLVKYNKRTKKVTLLDGTKIDVSRSKKDIFGDSKIEKYPIPIFEEFIYIDLKSILYLEAHFDRTEFHLLGSPPITSSKNIGFFEKSLADKPFFRIHNSYIISLTKVIKYFRGSSKVTENVGSSSGYAVLNTGKGLPVSANKKDDFLKYFR